MKVITMNEYFETAIFEIAKFEKTKCSMNTKKPWEGIRLVPCLKCYPLNPDEEPFPVIYNDMKYIAIDDVVVKDVTWINDLMCLLKRDKISFVELMNDIL